MPADIPGTLDSSFPSRRPAEQTLDEIQKQLRSLAARMERAESRLGIESPTAPARPDSSPTAGLATTTTDALAPPTPTPSSLLESLPRVPASSAATPPPFIPPASIPAPVRPQPSPFPLLPPESPAETASIGDPPTGAGSFMGSMEAMRDRLPGFATPEKRLLGDWENLIGGKWALWVGLFSLFLAIASFLAYTWKSLPPMPPSARMASGVATGIALIVASGFFRTRTQRWFSEGLAGAGLAVLYLSIWAGAQQYHLLSFNTAFTAMGLTTVLGVYLAVRFDAMSLSVLATLGGFLTPLLLRSKGVPGSELLQSNSLSLLTYVAVLNAGILAVSLFKRWNTLTWLSFIATVLLIGGWAVDDYSVADRWPTFAYFTIYFLLFVGTACFYSLSRREETDQPDLLLLFAATSVYALAGSAVLNGALEPVPGTFMFLLALFFGMLCGAVKLQASQNSTLIQSAGGLALLFLTVAVPVQFKQEGLAIGWCVEAGVLLLLGLRLRAPLLLRAGQVVWCLSILPLLGVLLETAPPPTALFFNERALPLLLSLLATALVVVQHWASKKASIVDMEGEESDARPVLLDELAPLYAGYVVLGGAWLLAQESYLWFSWNKWPNAGTWHAGALYTISSLVAVYAAATFTVGMKGRDVAVRLGALVVMALAMTGPAWTGLAYSTAGWTPFWNMRWLSYVVVALAGTGIGWMVNRSRNSITPEETESLGMWLPAVSLFTLWGMTVEVYCGFGQGAAAANGDWRAGAFFAIAILWGVFATLTLHLSYAWREPALRITSLVIAGLGSLLLLVASIVYSGVEWTPLFNLRAIAFAVTVGLLAVIALRENRYDTATFLGGQDRSQIASPTALLGTCLLLWGLTQESYITFEHFQSAFGAHWRLIGFFFISVLWSGGALALLSVGLRRSSLAFRFAAYDIAGLAGALLLWTALDATRLGWTPFLNARCIAFVLAALFLAGSSILLGKHQSQLSDREKDGAAIVSWIAGALLLWGITQEVYETCFYFRQVLGSYWVRWAQMLISLTWSVYGATLLIGGINRNYQPLRLAALGLLAFTVLKVFLFDLGFLSGPLRMFSLAGLGLSLIFISWLYGRYARSDRAAIPSTDPVE